MKVIVEVRPWGTRVAVLEEEELLEILTDKMLWEFSPKNIFKGKVVRVMPSIQAIFVNIGDRKAGFMLVGDKIYNEGDEIMVQISKEPFLMKGAKLTDKITIPGRYTVLTTEGRIGVSRRIRNADERIRLANALRGEISEKIGVIVRTEAENVDVELVVDDFRGLKRKLEEIKEKFASEKPPCLLWCEDNISRFVAREIITRKTEKVIIDGVSDEIKDILENFSIDIPLEEWHGSISAFEFFRINEKIGEALKEEVVLESGIRLRFQETEALCSIDVNTSSFRGGKDIEHTALWANLIAAKEIAKQVKLRRVGGIVIIDFIDMREEKNKERILSSLKRELRKRKVKASVMGITRLGLVEMSVKKEGKSLLYAMTEKCEGCEGMGRIPVGLVIPKVMEKVRRGEKPVVNPMMAKFLDVKIETNPNVPMWEVW